MVALVYCWQDCVLFQKYQWFMEMLWEEYRNIIRIAFYGIS